MKFSFLLRRFLRFIRGQSVASCSKRSLVAEQLEPRILFSAAPVEAPATEVVEAAPAPAPVAAQVGAPPANTPLAVEAPAEVAVAEGGGEVSENTALELVDVDETAASLNQEVVATLAAEARQRWIDSGITAQQIAALDSISYDIADVGGARLGVANGLSITIDDDAGGTGVGNWFIDTTPDLDEEFGDNVSVLVSGRFDLLSTLIHEQGHVLGLGDIYGSRQNVMDGLLDAGTRRLPTFGQAQGEVAGSMVGEHFLTANIVRASTNAAGAEVSGNSGGASISANGRYVAFYSSATTLVGGDSNGLFDVFVKDLVTGNVTRASTTSAGGQALGGHSGLVSISADGRFVVFHSDATNLVAGDSNGSTDIFVKNLETGELTRVSTDAAGAQSIGGDSRRASISADGRHIAFESDATNLVPGDSNGLRDVFVKDLKTGRVKLVSASSQGIQSLGGDSEDAVISANGRHVVFESDAANLVVGDSNGTTDVFVKNLRNGKLVRISTDAAGGQGVGGNSKDASISGDGRYVVFRSAADNLVADDTNSLDDIFLKDVRTGAVTRVNTSSAGTQAMGGGSSLQPTITADGRHVAFYSPATNLVGGDTNGVSDVFVKNVQSGELARVSTNSVGAESTGGTGSYLPAFSADGRFVAFHSDATNLVAADGNGNFDIFVKGVSAVTHPSTTSVELDASGNLVIRDIDGSDTNDRLFIGMKDGLLEISDSRNTVGSSIIGTTVVGSRGRGVSVSLNSFTGDIVVDAQFGDDIITIGDLSFLPGGIMINDDGGQDLIRQRGEVVLTGFSSLIYAAERIRLERGSALTTDAGSISLTGNLFNTAIGRVTAVFGNRSSLTSISGSINLSGTGGDRGGGNRGVHLKNTEIVAGVGINIFGGAGNTTGSGNVGVLLGSGTDLFSSDEIDINGLGAGNGKSSNVAVRLQNATLSTTGLGIDILAISDGARSNNVGAKISGTTISAIGIGDVDIQGVGSASATGSGNRGIVLDRSELSAANGPVFVHGTGGTGTSANSGVRVIRSSLSSALQDVDVTGAANNATLGNVNRGVYFSGSMISAGDEVDISANAGAGRSSNTGLTMRSTQVAGGGLVSIAGNALNGTSGSSNRGADLRSSDITGYGLLFTTIAGSGTSNNGALQMRGGSLFSFGTLSVNGFAQSGNTGSNNVGVRASSTAVGATGNISLTGTGGGGKNNNAAIQLSNVSVDSSGGSTTVSGVARVNTTGANNRGVVMIRSGLSAANGVTLQGTGGGGTNQNQGVRIVRGMLDAGAGGTLDIDGTARAGTSGSNNTGVYIFNGVQLGGNMVEVDGFGGGGNDFNHGIYLHRNITVVAGASSINGTAGNGATSENETGDFFP